MKAVIVNCFDTYEDRVDLVHECFLRKGYEVTVIQSDFMHIKKTSRQQLKNDYIFVKSKPYFKNLSLTRLYSHYKYGKDSFKVIEKIQPDLLYTFVPPNSLALFASKYKKRNRKMKLILDIIDLWPETLPIEKFKTLPPFTFWGKMRDNCFKYADHVITECELYQTVLSDALKNTKTQTIYLAKKEIKLVRKAQLSEKKINLAYLGSINNLIDITKIKEIIEAIKNVKPVTLHIIGDGESKQELIKEAKLSGANVIYYGKIYDPQLKQDIFDKCHFGLNIMKSSVCVGLTMKSIDYFQHGLPILNNIPSDTSKIVENYDVGLNVMDLNLKEFEKKIIFNKDNLVKRRNALNLYEELFSSKAFFKKLDKII
ncbi:glycosyltransferase [Facklamia miroungae]|uniref:Glycosyltransferase involved in cell wall bisynthesis n=1 Tax=Facklamia miroungae TaxID=120956 RepID=A0A1G7PIW9_9LACT|nr:glycosyltransferase [Facklamia miroungae]NKZ28723.1 glycosyltransferase family 4 protein [Facklamia miroungae]SDF86064.1 Glycosyltransferase involved in cell wall bisynthesis [Facklamia miroungae]